MAMDMDERWVNRSPEPMLETFHGFQGKGSIWCSTICSPCRRTRRSWPRGSACCRAWSRHCSAGRGRPSGRYPRRSSGARHSRAAGRPGRFRTSPATHSGRWPICSPAISCSRSSSERRRERLARADRGRRWQPGCGEVGCPGGRGAGVVMARCLPLRRSEPAALAFPARAARGRRSLRSRRAVRGGSVSTRRELRPVAGCANRTCPSARRRCRRPSGPAARTSSRS